MMRVPKAKAIILLLHCIAILVEAKRSNLPLRRTSPCEQRRWHIDIEIGNIHGCSNSFKFPSYWLSNSLVEAKMFYKTSDECCADLFGDGECHIDDHCDHNCDETSPKYDGTCELTSLKEEASAAASPNNMDDHCAKWHFNLDTKDGCTNDMNYPKAWKSSSLLERKAFFDMPYACCSKFFEKGDCTVHDVCNSRISSIRKIKSDGDNMMKEDSIQLLAGDLLDIYYYGNITGKMKS